MNEIEALTILADIPGLKPDQARTGIRQTGSATAFLNLSATQLQEFLEPSDALLHSWGLWKQDFGWRQNLEIAARHGVQPIPYTDPLYPRHLLTVSQAPLILYANGDLLPVDNHSIAIVGTRKATTYGMEMAEKIAHGLAKAGFTIVSGLAHGIDTAAHRGAIAAGRSIAVIGSGLAHIYPHENRRLADCIAASGAILSEYPMATAPDRWRFPKRNRIISGMTLGTLLIEAPAESGAMLAMHHAAHYGRKLFVLPGPANCPTFHGNHRILKEGGAQLIENEEDIICAYESLFALN